MLRRSLIKPDQTSEMAPSAWPLTVAQVETVVFSPHRDDPAAERRHKTGFSMFLQLEPPHAEAFLPHCDPCEKAPPRVNGIIPAVALPVSPLRKHGPAFCGEASPSGTRVKANGC